MRELNLKNANIQRTNSEKILQFGGGNFLRGFVDWMIERLNEETNFNGDIVIVKPTEEGDYKVLKAQDGLFHVILNGTQSDETEIRLITCINRVIHAYNEWDAFLKTAETPSIRYIISNTTEAGITYRDLDTNFDQPPKEFPAKLTLWLYHRFAFFQGAPDKGCILFPCELIDQNGLQLKECILRCINCWSLNEDFKYWIQNHNYFCNTLVDRIISGYPHKEKDSLISKLGYDDNLLVAGELYHSWVIEGPELVEEELPFHKTNINVKFVEDVSLYSMLKVRVLNGAHTAMVPVALLMGLKYVDEAIKHRLVGHFVKSLLKEEVSPTLKLVSIEVNTFIEDVLERFQNPTIKHQLQSIALNSISKFRTRLLPTFKDYYELNNSLPPCIVFAFAALIQFYQGTLDGKDVTLSDNQEMISTIQSQWSLSLKKRITLLQMTTSILSNDILWGEDLTRYERLATEICTWLERFDQYGVAKSLDQFNTSGLR